MSERRPYSGPEKRKTVASAPGAHAWPVPGLYQGRLVTHGPLVAMRIRHEVTPDPWVAGNRQDRSWYWHGDINGVPDKYPRPIPTDRVWRIWHCRDLNPVTPERYEWLVKDREWARKNAPLSAEARPHKRVRPIMRDVEF
jgi:hypothetical protein